MFVAVSGLLGGLAFNVFWHYAKVEDHFYSDVGFMRQHVRELMAQNESILSGFSAFLIGSRVADIHATQAYSQRMLKRYPHILMFEVAQRVNKENEEPFASYLKEQSISPPRIWSFDYENGISEHDLKTDGEAFPIIFIDPPSEDVQLGLDINSIDFVHKVVKKLSNGDQLLMTEPFEMLDGEMAIVMMQGVNVSDSNTPSYVALLVIRVDQLVPHALKNTGWDFSLSSKDTNGFEFDLLRTENYRKTKVDAWLPALISTDYIKLTDFDLTLNIQQQLTWRNFDWLHILGLTLLMLVFPVFVLITSRIHHGIEQQNLVKRKELYQLANFDTLTGLANRFHFYDFGQRILSTAQRNNHHVAVFFIDLNGFKKINDNLGHDVGDLVLKRVAETLLASVRKGDIVARIGGDEFSILVDQMEGLENLMSMLTNIRLAIDSINFPETEDYKVSGSVGFSFTEYHDYDLSKLVKMADNSMYGEKEEHYKGALVRRV